MATGNFYNINANSIFALNFDEDWQYYDLIDCIVQELQNSKKGNFWAGGTDSNESRSYPSRVIGSLIKTFAYKDFNISVTITAIIRSGYYTGANLDWELSFEIDGTEIVRDDLANEIIYAVDYSISRARRYAELVNKKFDKLANVLVNEVERIFTKHSERYYVAARFSNGETIYQKL